MSSSFGDLVNKLIAGKTRQKDLTQVETITAFLVSKNGGMQQSKKQRAKRPFGRYSYCGKVSHNARGFRAS